MCQVPELPEFQQIHGKFVPLKLRERQSARFTSHPFAVETDIHLLEICEGLHDKRFEVRIPTTGGHTLHVLQVKIDFAYGKLIFRTHTIKECLVKIG